MKEYPAIPRSTGQNFREFDAYVFDKLDGSNLRFEWSPKTGWSKAGTRHHLFDESDAVFGEALPLFESQWAEALAQIARKERWQRLTAFFEFWGDKSLAGVHFPEDPKHLTLLDVCPLGQEMLPSREYLKLFGDLEIPNFLGTYRWTRGLIEEVRRGEIEGITFEGVVGKGQERNRIVMAKAKTQNWIDLILSHYGAEAGQRIIES
jgi:hypothetical protein